MQLSKKYIAATLIVWSTLASLVAQDVSIRGEVFEGTSGQPVSYASVAVYAMADTSLVAGLVTDDAGRFNLNCKGGTEVFVVIQLWVTRTIALLHYF